MTSASWARDYFDLEATDIVHPAAMWSYDVDGLSDYVGLLTDAFDYWLEEDDLVVGLPRNSRHRVDAVPSHRQVVIRDEGRILADTERPIAVF